MDYCFIKKGKTGFDFCISTVDYENHFNTMKYSCQDAEMQVISNNAFLVFYSGRLVRELLFLKIMFEEELAIRENISAKEITDEIVPKIIKLLHDYHSLIIKEGDGIEMKGHIIIVSCTDVFLIDRIFVVSQRNNYLDGNRIPVKVCNEIMNNPTPLELLEASIIDDKEARRGIDYPFLYGNSNDKVFHLKYENEIKDVAREEWICRW